MVVPMLARGIEGDPDRYIRDPEWVCELKCNGKRMVANGTMGKLRFFNRSGVRTDAPKHLLPELQILIDMNIVLDGEIVDKDYWVFDMPCCGELVSPKSSWEDRHDALEAFFKLWKPKHVRLLPVARTTARKRAMMKKIWAAGAEGAVFKRTTSAYHSGEPRNGSWLKAKNVRTVDCVVKSFGTDKHNMQLVVYRDGEEVEIGECSRYEGDAPRAQVGDVVEIQFLDAGKHPDAPRLCQPHCKSLRTDKRAEQCLIDQLDGSWVQRKVLV